MRGLGYEETISMKILVVGDGHSALHEVAVANAFVTLGHHVHVFYWQPYFQSKNRLVRLWQRAQNKFIYGPTIARLNADLIKAVVEFNPAFVFIYRGTHVYPHTLDEIKKKHPSCIICGYNNDDPFAEGHPPWLWRNFLRCISKYDLVFAYRHHNLDDFLRVGAKRVELLRSWYIPELNHPIGLSGEDEASYGCDVVFIGHYENDGRLEFLEEIVRNGFKLRLYGPGYEWDSLLNKSVTLRHLAPVHLVWNDEYNKALAGGAIALCFLSKLNRDTYTRRCFEIPATGTLLLSEYSGDLATLYRAGEEADFFKTKEEMIQKIKLYSSNKTLRSSVALNGRQRVVVDGHDIVSRMKYVLEVAALSTSANSTDRDIL